MNDILDDYAAAATPELIERYEAFDPAVLSAPVLDLLPQTPGRVADIGTGTGRDAAWFAAQGHRVLAVEPVPALRDAGMAAWRQGDHMAGRYLAGPFGGAGAWAVRSRHAEWRVAAYRRCGARRCLALLRCRETQSHQAANRDLGVRWTWMAFERPSV